jgi:hypothetical protein
MRKRYCRVFRSNDSLTDPELRDDLIAILLAGHETRRRSGGRSSAFSVPHPLWSAGPPR